MFYIPLVFLSVFVNQNVVSVKVGEKVQGVETHPNEAKQGCIQSSNSKCFFFSFLLTSEYESQQIKKIELERNYAEHFTGCKTPEASLKVAKTLDNVPEAILNY